MATKVSVILVDDTDGTPAETTVQFGIDGHHYEIDLSAPNANALRQALERYVRAARPQNTRTNRRRPNHTGAGNKAHNANSRPKGTERAENDRRNRAIREWAEAHGHTLGRSGRFPTEVLTAYAQATATTAPPGRHHDPATGVMDLNHNRADGNNPTGPPGSEGEHQLQKELGTSARARAFYNHQVLEHLTDDMCAFIRNATTFFIATADAHGHADCSLRAGPAGFVRVLNSSTIAWPEYQGNGVMASLGNLTENPHVGLLIVDFTEDRIGLHVNATVQIGSAEDLGLDATNEETAGDDPSNTRRKTVRWILATIDEAYVHCSKNIPAYEPAPPEDTHRATGDYFGTKGVPRPWH